MSEIKQHKQDKKAKIAKTIDSNFLRKGYEELIKTMGGGEKKTSTKQKDLAKNQISPDLDKYENTVAKKRTKH